MTEETATSLGVAYGWQDCTANVLLNKHGGHPTCTLVFRLKRFITANFLLQLTYYGSATVLFDKR